MHGHRLRFVTRTLSGLLAAVALTACGAGGDAPAGEDPGSVGSEPGGEAGDPDDAEPDDGETDSSEPGSGEPGAGGDEEPAVENLDDAVELAVQDAAGEHGVAPDAVEVVRADEVDWPDGARGCPRDGEVYTQAVAPGYLIVVEVDGQRVRYHAGEGEAPFRCDDPQPPL